MTLKTLATEIYSKVLSDMMMFIDMGYKEGTTEIDTADGWISITLLRDSETPMPTIFHYADDTRRSTNMEQWAGKQIPTWEEAYLEYEEANGDGTYDGLDPAFSSWDEVNGMFYMPGR